MVVGNSSFNVENFKGGITITNKNKTCADCKDMWNAFMVRGANFPKNGIGIPLCPTTAKEIPSELISYTEARATYNRLMNRGDKNFFVNAFVHFYQHDHKFDGTRRGIWFQPRRAAEIFHHFAGIITPDFSTNLDFPFPWKIFNTYRMRTFGYWYGTLGGVVINNVRWGEEDTFSWCFEGIPQNSIVSIGTVASGLRDAENRELFEKGFFKMIEVLRPHTIIVYGSDKYPCFDSIRQKIKIAQFDSERALAFKEASS